MKLILLISIMLFFGNFYPQKNELNVEKFHNKIVIGEKNIYKRINQIENTFWNIEGEKLTISNSKNIEILFPLDKNIAADSKSFSLNFFLTLSDTTWLKYIQIGFTEKTKHTSFFNEMLIPNKIECNKNGNDFVYQFEHSISTRLPNPKYLFFRLISTNQSINTIEIDSLKLFTSCGGNSNLVANGGFEEHYICPQGYFTNIYELKNWQNNLGDKLALGVENIETTTVMELRQFNETYVELGTPDLICNCNIGDKLRFEHFNAYSGDCQALIIVGATSSKKGNPGIEYLCTKLQENLEKGAKYKLEFKFRFANQISRYEVYNLGVKLDTIPYTITDEQMLSNKPKLSEATFMVSESSYKDDSDWKNFSTEFISSDDFSFLTIGPFDNSSFSLKRNTNTGISYIYVDEVILKKI